MEKKINQLNQVGMTGSTPPHPPCGSATLLWRAPIRLLDFFLPYLANKVSKVYRRELSASLQQ